MDSIWRVIRRALWFCVGVLIAAIPIFAHAASIPATLVDWRVAGSAAYSGGTPLASCKAYQPAYCASCIDSVVSGETKTTAYCDFKYSSGSWMGAGVATTAAYTCPDGWTKNVTSSSATCTHSDPVCTAPQIMNATTGACESPCPAAGTTTSADFWGSGATYPSSICATNGCLVTTGFCGAGGADGKSGKWSCSGGTYTGASCTGNLTAPAETPGTTPAEVPPDSPYKKCVDAGQSWGTVNGVVVCSPNSSTNTTKTSSTTPSSGPASTTSVTNNTACSGDGSCSTTTTTTTVSGGSGPGGTGTGSTTSTSTTKVDQPKATFCAENPTASICQNSSFAGSCDAAPACTGDAVQCAQANAAFELKCSAVKDDDQQKLARDVVAGNDPKAGQLPNPNSPTEVAIGTLDNTEIFAAGCPSSPTITAFGHSYTFSLTPLCSMGETLGKLNVMLALMGALWIVAGSVKGA